MRLNKKIKPYITDFSGKRIKAPANVAITEEQASKLKLFTEETNKLPRMKGFQHNPALWIKDNKKFTQRDMINLLVNYRACGFGRVNEIKLRKVDSEFIRDTINWFTESIDLQDKKKKINMDRFLHDAENFPKKKNKKSKSNNWIERKRKKKEKIKNLELNREIYIQRVEICEKMLKKERKELEEMKKRETRLSSK